MMQQVVAAPAVDAPPHVSPRGMWVSKLVLRIIEFALAISIIGLVSALAESVFYGIGTLIIITPQAAVSVVWTFCDFICILARGGRRGIHPGANVALDLLLWLGLVAGTIVLWLVGLASDIAGYDSYSYISGSSRYYTSYYNGSIAGRGQAILGLAATLTVFHFTSFVIACVETHQRNRAARIVYVTTPMVFTPPYFPQYGQPQYGQPQYTQPVAYAPTPPPMVYQPDGTKPA
ncbi:hypothetical protein C8A05DRAFT_34110 [Staphylotrichum tortipilum]|uniref:MARVEL domain-containing protein n=1 Tax=Staphylotrichum tortipilum TaxID=2831512 RepID=A0AAN6ML40_9PEZI|nr:hypothetical protein C8A05DRAFT_34110 [Staphylotrichum longicolle]